MQTNAGRTLGWCFCSFSKRSLQSARPGCTWPQGLPDITQQTARFCSVLYSCDFCGNKNPVPHTFDRNKKHIKITQADSQIRCNTAGPSPWMSQVGGTETVGSAKPLPGRQQQGQKVPRIPTTQQPSMTKQRTAGIPEATCSSFCKETTSQHVKLSELGGMSTSTSQSRFLSSQFPL